MLVTLALKWQRQGDPRNLLASMIQSVRDLISKNKVEAIEKTPEINF